MFNPCLPPVATKMTGASLSRRLQWVVHFPPVRARDNPRRRGVPAEFRSATRQGDGREAIQGSVQITEIEV